MKLVLLCLFVSLPAFAADAPFTETFPVVGDDVSSPVIEKDILRAYQDALASARPNLVKTEVAKLAAKLHGDPRIDQPTASDLLLDRSMFVQRPSDWEGTYLLGVPAYATGTGSELSHGLYLRVSFHALTNHDTDEQTVKIVFEGTVKVSGN